MSSSMDGRHCESPPRALIHQGQHNSCPLGCCQRSPVTIPGSHSGWAKRERILWPEPSPVLTSCPIVHREHGVASTLFHSRALAPSGCIQLRLKSHCLSQLPFWNIHPADRDSSAQATLPWKLRGLSGSKSTRRPGSDGPTEQPGHHPAGWPRTANRFECSLYMRGYCKWLNPYTLESDYLCSSFGSVERDKFHDIPYM